MKKNNTQQLNRLSKWKTVVVLVSLLIMTLSALPSLYGELPAVHVNAQHQTDDATSIANILEQSGVTPRQIEHRHDQIIITLDDTDQQGHVQSLLQYMLDDSVTVALAMEPAAPRWLINAGFSPISLGLDLRGGVQFLLDVDMKPVYQAHQQSLVEQFSSEFRGSRVRESASSMDVQLPNRISNSEARRFVQQEFPQWTVRGSGQTLTLSLSDSEKTEIRRLIVQQNLQIMRQRLNELGITEASVQRQGDSRIRIELPGVQDPAAAKEIIGATASLAFHLVPESSHRQTISVADEQGNPINLERRPVLSGEHIIDARASIGEYGKPEVNITLDSFGGRAMSQFTRSHIGQPMATVYSEYSQDANGNSQQMSEVISIATIQSQLANRFRITGTGSLSEAQDLALLLRAGSLTAPVTVIEERTIGPTLGAENVKSGFASLALGLGLTLVFLAFWYRKLGWVANTALVANMICLLGLVALLPGAVLTLPGIAGMVLTVGMAVDTNVLIFERIKDKMREGRTFAQSIDKGFNSAFASIFDANLTTLIVAIALYTIGNGPIQGFAITLGLGLLTSMFTGIFLSRVVINFIWGRDNRRDIKV
ncbi:protein translocase subunit SecD [Vibrio sp. 188UL20-2]|uniref:Protein translocase subunit SecD n=1 Tax=Vibrio ulleungensis TaxID=2807619 RepID=A0ABS2HHC7_9VIBR|nr:protein translocase subunit SecD [Vibrio ulleungensis]MBM7036940.1 protein translocase subunit SecD [Vibrio ulleungensis]